MHTCSNEYEESVKTVDGSSKISVSLLLRKQLDICDDSKYV